MSRWVIRIISLLVLCVSVNAAAINIDPNISFSVSEYEKALVTGNAIQLKNNDDEFITPQIIGGSNASRNEYPEYALVLISDAAGDIIGTCGGTLIASNKVLTAAHCSQEPSNRYFIVPNFYSFNDSIDASDVFLVSRIAVHPNYNDSTIEYDIAVLTLDRNSSTPTAGVHAGSNKFVGSDATVIGTGRTQTVPAQFSDILQEVDTPIVSNSACNDQWRSAFGISPVTSNMVCAGFLSDGRGSCFGDSGGPLLTNINNQRTLVGTVSFGFNICEDQRLTSVYARVGTMVDFISSESPNTSLIESNRKAVSLAPIYSLLLDDSIQETTSEKKQASLSSSSLQPTIDELETGQFAIEIESQLGDYIGGGQRYSYNASNSNLSVQVFNDNLISIYIDGWSWDMHAASSEKLVPGVYDNAIKYPFNTANGLSFSGYNRGCNNLIGRFRIFEIEYNGIEISKLIADFTQNCEGNSEGVLRGSIHYDVTIEPGAALKVASLVNEQLNPPIPALLENESGYILIIESEDGDFIGQGENYLLTHENSTISLSNLFSNTGIQIDINSQDQWSLVLERGYLESDPLKGQPLTSGIYENAAMYPSNGMTPGLGFSGAGRGCNSLEGQFRVFKISYDNDGQLNELEADFEQNCGGLSAGILRGSIIYKK